MAEDDSPAMRNLGKLRCNTPVVPWSGAEIHYCEHELRHEGPHSWEHLLVGKEAEADEEETPRGTEGLLDERRYDESDSRDRKNAGDEH